MFLYYIVTTTKLPSTGLHLLFLVSSAIKHTGRSSAINWNCAEEHYIHFNLSGTAFDIVTKTISSINLGAHCFGSFLHVTSDALLQSVYLLRNRVHAQFGVEILTYKKLWKKNGAKFLFDRLTHCKSTNDHQTIGDNCRILYPRFCTASHILLPHLRTHHKISNTWHGQQCAISAFFCKRKKICHLWQPGLAQGILSKFYLVLQQDDNLFQWSGSS